MFRILLASVLVSLVTTPIYAEDYLLRVEIIGFETEDADDPNPEETLFSSMEILVREKLPFRNRVQIGDQTLSLHGELKSVENKKMSIQLRFSDCYDNRTRDSIVRETAKAKDILTSTETTVVVQPGEPLTIGSSQTKKSQTGLDGSTGQLHTRKRLVVTVTEYQPD